MIVLACLLAYIIGSIPNGLIVSRVVAGIDIRQYGSHNIGATNVWTFFAVVPWISWW